MGRVAEAVAGLLRLRNQEESKQLNEKQTFFSVAGTRFVISFAVNCASEKYSIWIGPIRCLVMSVRRVYFWIDRGSLGYWDFMTQSQGEFGFLFDRIFELWYRKTGKADLKKNKSSWRWMIADAIAIGPWWWAPCILSFNKWVSCGRFNAPKEISSALV